MKRLVDCCPDLLEDVQQNQGTQGHRHGYLGVLKALSPELIEDVTITKCPFNAEYRDFSGLGVVQIRQRESLPDYPGRAPGERAANSGVYAGGTGLVHGVD